MYRVYQTNVDESMKACAVLLDDPDIDIAVRVGDIYSFLVQHYASSKDYKQVHACFSNLIRNIFVFVGLFFFEGVTEAATRKTFLVQFCPIRLFL